MPAQLAINIPLVTPIRGDGSARFGVADTDWIALVQARRRKERKYLELVGHRSRARFVLFAVDVGGLSTR